MSQDAFSHRSDPHILVAGAGAMGCLFGGLLAEKGLRVTLLARRADHVDAIRARGLLMRGEGGDRAIRLKAETDPAAIAPADIVLIQCKAAATRAVAAAAKPLLTRGGVAISFQNGLGNEEAIAAELGDEAVIGGLTSLGATLEAPGIVRNYASLPTVIGEFRGGSSARVSAIAALFTAHGIPTEASADIMREKWRKLLLNVALSATSGLTGLTIGEIEASPALARMARRAMDEAAEVAAACGVDLPVGSRYALFEGVANSGAARNKTSMRRDMEEKRPSELDAIYGSVIALGRKHGVPTPTLDALHALAQGVESLYAPREEPAAGGRAGV